MDYYLGLLKKSDGSFYQWLECNAPDWKHNIGLIADEEGILYNTMLSPVKSNDDSSSFYGVELDLTSLHKEILSPSDIKNKVTRLNNDIQKTHDEQHHATYPFQLEALRYTFSEL